MKSQPIKKKSASSVLEKSAQCQDENNSVTYHVQVIANPEFIEEQSDPTEPRYVFAYRIVLHNRSEMAVQLISRHWVITDATGQERQIDGIGVLGEQPQLEAGSKFEYTSYCPLPTSTGSMRGTYLMKAANGEHFEAQIPEFHLIGPRVLH